MTQTPLNQLTPHSGDRVDYAGRYGLIAGLRTQPLGTSVGTVLLVPGYTGSKEDFAPILDPVAAAGFVAVAVDQPGQYQSVGPDDETAYSPTELGTVIADLIGTLQRQHPGPVVLLGHSYGGLVARGAVIAGADVAGLTLLCSGPAAFTGGPRLEALQLGQPVLIEQGLANAYAFREGLSEELRGQPEPAIAAFRRERFLRSTVAGLLGMGNALQTEPDRTAPLAATGVPVAVVAGIADDAWPLSEQSAMAATLGTELVLIPDAAHSPAVENPAGLLEVLLPTWRRWVRR